MMTYIPAFLVIILLAIVLIHFVPVRWKGGIALAVVIVIALGSSIPAIAALSGTGLDYSFPGSLVTGSIPVRVDALSGWFILIINFLFITGGAYGLQNMKPYKVQTANLTLHCTSFLVLHSSLVAICSLQNMIAFLVAWETMAISTFLLVIFEHNKKDTLKAGINYLVQSHVSILLLTLGFIWVAITMHAYDFNAIRQFSAANPQSSGIALFLCFFVGFAIKAGFVPFHTWLPYAHPAAPTHISAIMSGVIIKIGIYGILRMLLLIKTDYLAIGYLILFISLLSGIYGVMLAIIQHNLKKLLAYHSIENIGIIGIGIGVGCIGMGKENYLLTVLGFSGALLHSLNHALFKSLLFFVAGNVYRATHTLQIEKLGGLGKRMPHTAALFLVAALAICGLPPLNGFVSEFLIYNGLFTGLQGSDMALLSSLIGGVFALSLVGGLAILCFTKAFGTVFLGTPRHHLTTPPEEASSWKLMPMYGVLLLMVAIGLFPGFFLSALSKPLQLFTSQFPHTVQPGALPAVASLQDTGIYAMLFIAITAVIYFVKKRMIAHRPVTVNATWGCAYSGVPAKMQYTASSFVRAFRKLAEPLLLIGKKKRAITGVFPDGGSQETHPYDKTEKWLIDYPLLGIKRLFNRFSFLQNGNHQFYILYGVVFILLVLIIPVLSGYIKALIQFLNHL